VTSVTWTIRSVTANTAGRRRHETNSAAPHIGRKKRARFRRRRNTYGLLNGRDTDIFVKVFRPRGGASYVCVEQRIQTTCDELLRHIFVYRFARHGGHRCGGRVSSNRPETGRELFVHPSNKPPVFDNNIINTSTPAGGVTPDNNRSNNGDEQHKLRTSR